MTAEALRWARLKPLFETLAAQPAAAREAAIAAAGLDGATADELRSLLAHHDSAQAADFLPGSASEVLAMAPSRIGQRFGAWEVVREIGGGGMGDVFEARRADGSFEGRAAVKLLKRGMDSQAVLRRFAHERQVLARLAHPHIARLLDAGLSADGLPYFVMELVAGRPIDEVAAALPLADRLGMFLQLADAVSYAHRNLLVHRDLKPGNVLVADDGQVKLLDFGIAKALDPGDAHDGAEAVTLTLADHRPYTPGYASPEQVRGEPVSTATDVYSLGVLLFRILTGTLPTGRDATSALEAARRVLDEAPARASALADVAMRPALQGDLDNILMMALAKAPEARYASVDAFASDVRAHLTGRPVAARAPSVAYVWGKFLRRHRWSVLAGGLGVLGLASGLAAALLKGAVAAALGALGLAAGLAIALAQGRQAALSRDEARRQLAGVKRIASELVFRYGDAISQLPGGARSQEAMLKETVASLDVTLAQAPNDADLIVLVASALGRLAQIQGNPAFAGSERRAEAKATVARSLALGAQVWEAKCGDWNFACQHLITLLTQANMLRNDGDPGAGLQVLEQAAARATQALERPLSDAGRANVLEMLASIHMNMAHFNDHAARPSLRRPQEALRFYALAEDEYARLYADPQACVAMERALSPGSPTVEEWANHHLANIHVGRALVHQRLGDAAAMKQSVLTGLARHEDNLRRNPGSAVWRQSVMFDHGYLATARLMLGEHEAALEAAQRAWDIVGERLREEGETGMWPAARDGLAGTYARALFANGRPEQALASLAFALPRAEMQRREADTPAARQREAGLQVLDAQCRQALGDAAGTARSLAAALPMLESLVDDPEVGTEARQSLAQALECRLAIDATRERGGASGP
jgi:tetratricopeptide (TPR) repeat protein